jgi:hypothetical protein
MFRTFIRIDPTEYVGKKVVTACVGRGKEVHYALKFGADLVFVNEIGDEIYDIPNLFPSQKNRLVICRSDISNSPFKNQLADLVICDHALQHIQGQFRGYKKLSAMAKPGGKIGVCVYSHENNFIMTHIVEPAKIFLQYIPLRVLRFLAYGPASLILAYIGLILTVEFTFSKKRSRYFPLYDHMIFWSKNSLKKNATACFDLLHAPVSYHFSRSEMENLSIAADQKILVLENTHGTTWSMVAEQQ